MYERMSLVLWTRAFGNSILVDSSRQSSHEAQMTGSVSNFNDSDILSLHSGEPGGAFGLASNTNHQRTE